MKISRTILIMMAQVFLLSLLASCEKKDSDPAWVGTWINEDTVDFLEIGIPVPVRTTLILLKTNFEWFMSAQVFGQYLDVVIVKGDLNANDKEFTIRPKTMAMANEQGELEWINEGDPGWEDVLSEWELGESNTVGYKTENNTLILSLGNESIVLTRQK